MGTPFFIGTYPKAKRLEKVLMAQTHGTTLISHDYLQTVPALAAAIGVNRETAIIFNRIQEAKNPGQIGKNF